MVIHCAGVDALVAALHTVSPSSAGVARCKQAVLALIKNDKLDEVLKVVS